MLARSVVPLANFYLLFYITRPASAKLKIGQTLAILAAVLSGVDSIFQLESEVE
jgi:hypothetical protein